MIFTNLLKQEGLVNRQFGGEGSISIWEYGSMEAQRN